MGRLAENHIGEPCRKCGALRVGRLYVKDRTVCRTCQTSEQRDNRIAKLKRLNPSYTPRVPRTTNLKSRLDLIARFEQWRRRHPEHHECGLPYKIDGVSFEPSDNRYDFVPELKELVI